MSVDDRGAIIVKIDSLGEKIDCTNKSIDRIWDSMEKMNKSIDERFELTGKGMADIEKDQIRFDVKIGEAEGRSKGYARGLAWAVIAGGTFLTTFFIKLLDWLTKAR